MDADADAGANADSDTGGSAIALSGLRPGELKMTHSVFVE